MHRPANLTTFEEAQADRLEDLSRTLASLRRAVTTGDRIAIETYCLAFCRRLQPSPIRLDDAEELRHSLRTWPAASSPEFASGCEIPHRARLRPRMPTGDRLGLMEYAPLHASVCLAKRAELARDLVAALRHLADALP